MKRQNKIRRRNVLRFSGATLAALTGATRVIGASQGEEMVDYVAYVKGNSPNREKVRKKVTYKHWEVRHTATDLRDKVMQHIKDKWGMDTLLSTKFTSMEDSPTGFGVHVNYSHYHRPNGTVDSPEPSIKEVRKHLPNHGVGEDQQDGHAFRREEIPIRIVECHEYPASNCSGEGILCQYASEDWYEANEYNSYPGGILCQANSDINSTLCPEFKETGDGYGSGWIGSGHSIDVGEDVYYPTNTDTFLGTCKKANDDLFNEVEWAFVDASDGHQGAVDAMAFPDGTDYKYNVVGIVSNNELVNDVGTLTEYYSHARSTCELTEYLDGVHSDNDAVEYYHDIESGDSGGPLFKLDANGDALMAASHVVEIQIGSDEDTDDCNDDGRGTTAETIEEKVPGEWVSD